MDGLVGIVFLGLLFLTIIPILILVKVLTDDEINNDSKILWAVLLLLANLVGVVIYILVPDKNILKK